MSKQNPCQHNKVYTVVCFDIIVYVSQVIISWQDVVRYRERFSMVSGMKGIGLESKIEDRYFLFLSSLPALHVGKFPGVNAQSFEMTKRHVDKWVVKKESVHEARCAVKVLFGAKSRIPQIPSIEIPSCISEFEDDEYDDDSEDSEDDEEGEEYEDDEDDEGAKMCS
jgi:hypothetical protein